MHKVRTSASDTDTRRHLPENTIQELGDMVRIGDELYSKVKAPMDGLLDSRYLLNISDMGAEMTRTMRLDADAFDMDEYMQKVAHFIDGTTATASSRIDESADDMSHMFNGDTDTWNWDRLGLLAARHSRRAPVSEHLLGPLQVTPKHRKATRTARLDTDAEQVAPQRLDASAIAQSETETSRMVLDIARRLEECCDEDGINLFRFALNPNSFSDSVENLFYISFLIRDGKAAIIEDSEGDPILCMLYKLTQCYRKNPLKKTDKRALHGARLSWSLTSQSGEICLPCTISPPP